MRTIAAYVCWCAVRAARKTCSNAKKEVGFPSDARSLSARSFERNRVCLLGVWRDSVLKSTENLV